MDLDGAGPDVVASDSAGPDGVSSASAAPRWSHVSPFTNGRFAFVRRHPADCGSAKTADATGRCTAPLRRVEELLGWAALSAEEQAQLRAASRLVGTGAGTKVKGRQRKKVRRGGRAAAADDGSGRAVSESNGSDAAEEERDSQSPRRPVTHGSSSKKPVAAAASPRPQRT